MGVQNWYMLEKKLMWVLSLNQLGHFASASEAHLFAVVGRHHGSCFVQATAVGFQVAADQNHGGFWPDEHQVDEGVVDTRIRLTWVVWLGGGDSKAKKMETHMLKNGDVDADIKMWKNTRVQEKEGDKSISYSFVSFISSFVWGQPTDWKLNCHSNLRCDDIPPVRSASRVLWNWQPGLCQAQTAKTLPDWWLNPTLLKNMKVNWDHEIPNIWKTCSKPPPSFVV